MAEELSMDDFENDDSLELFNELSNEKGEEIKVDDTLSEEEQEKQELEAKELEESKKLEETPSDNIKPDKSQNENLSLFASALAEEGVISLPEGADIKSYEDLVKVIQDEIKNNEFSGLNDKQKDYLDALSKGISHDEYTNMSSKMESVESITEDKLKENEDLQKQLLVEDYVSRGYSKEKAETLSQRSVDLNTLYEDSLESLNNKKENLKLEKQKLEKAKVADIENQKTQYLEIQEKIKKAVFDEKSEIIPGIKYSKKVADEVFNALTKPAGVDENQQPITRAQKIRSNDPLKFEHTLNTLLVLTKDFTDFNVFKTEGNTRKAKEFLDKLKPSSSSQANGYQNLSDDSLEDDLDWIQNTLLKE